MFKVSKSAAEEIKRSLQEHEFDDMPIRIAAEKDPDGAIHYQMGFDEPGPGDTMIATRGVDVVIAKDHLALLNGTEIDFVEIEDKTERFIFLNPNDPDFVAPHANDSDAGDSGR